MMHKKWLVIGAVLGLIIVFLLFAVGVLLGLLLSANTSVNPVAQPSQVSDLDRNNPNALSAVHTAQSGLGQAASKAGINRCIPRIDQVGAFLGRETEIGAYLFQAPHDPDQTLFSSSMEVVDKEGSVYASASFAPTLDGNCSGVYEVTRWWPDICEKVAASAFPSYTESGFVARDVYMLHNGVNIRVFFIKAGEGCVTIKKEALY